MLKKIILGTVILLLGWSLVLKFLPNDINLNQNQWNSNLIKAESFLFERPKLTGTSIILGSSMAASLPINKATDSLINLAFAGLSPYDGLELVMAKAQKPSTVYIEMNTVFNDSNTEFHDAVFSPIQNWLKSAFSIFLTKNQPVAVIKGLIRYKRTTIEEDRVIAVHEAPPAINTKILDVFVKQYTNYPSKSLIVRRLDKLGFFVRALEKQRCNVVFFEMPIHPSLCESPLSTKVREELHKRFSKERYTYISQPECTLFHTSDGIHLTAGSAALYATYLSTNINRLTYNAVSRAYHIN